MEENRAVKRTVIVAAAVLALGMAAYVSRLWAQQTAAAPEPRTRIALLNLSLVIKNYQKFNAFQDEIKHLLGPYQTTDTQLKQRLDALAKDAQTAPPDKREQIEGEVKELQRKMQDNKDAASKVVGKKQEEQLKILYWDVKDTAQRYAVGHNFEMVLHYNDAPPDEYWSGPNIARKIQNGALMPLYAVPGMDITNEVVDTLNAAYRAQAGGAAQNTATATPRQQ
jgi:Skp family chaperone for outer membrane proteins